MNNDDLQAFGLALTTTLEPGDTDKHGNQYSDIEAYNVEMDKQNDSAVIDLSDRPF